MNPRTVDDAEDRSRLEVIGFGGMFADAIWSNGNLKAYCLRCRAQAPEPSFEMLLYAETICAACGNRVDDGAR